MIWGIDYSPDGSIWYTDETFDSIWRFSLQDESYQRLPYPSEGNSLPQKLRVVGSQIIINDFTGNKITFLDPNQIDAELPYLSIPSPFDGAVTGDFTVDEDNNILYTNWVFQQSGVLVKFDQEGYLSTVRNTGEGFLPLDDYIDVLPLPNNLLTPNGVTITNDGRIWLVDTSSSNFFSFDPENEIFTQYVTSDPPLLTYGNSSGVIKTPISRPYWIETNDLGQLVFNEQTANRLAVMDPKSESLVEYFVPSMNPNWGDCGELDNCGLAQIFDFTVDGDKIWFTEWVENNIGVVDTSIELPLYIELESNIISLKAGQSRGLTFVVSPQTSQDLFDVSLILSGTNEFLTVASDSNVPHTFQLDFDAPRPIAATISASENAPTGTYKVLLGAQTDEVSVSKFLTVIIES
jgi:virginiamycin B lyase